MVQSFLIFAAWIGVALAAEDRPTADAKDSAQKTYDGLTLPEWRARIKSLDLKDPASAAAVPGLIAIVKDRTAVWFSRRQAAETLGRLGPLAPEGVAVILDAMEEPSRDETPPRLWGLKALALYGPTARSAAPRLLTIVRDTNRPLLERQSALEAVAQIGPVHPEVLPTVIALLQSSQGKRADRSPDAEALRELAVETFTLLGPRGAPAIPALVRLANDPSDVLRMKVAQALGAMGGRGEIAIPTLVERLLFDASPLVRDAAAEALAGIGVEAVPTLVQLLDDEDAEVRKRCVKALGTIGRGARPAGPALASHLEDESAEVRMAAAEAIWQVSRDSSLAAPAAARALADEDRTIRLRAFRLLGRMGPHAAPAAQQLRQLQSDERAQVRQAAERTLERIQGSPR